MIEKFEENTHVAAVLVGEVVTLWLRLPRISDRRGRVRPGGAGRAGAGVWAGAGQPVDEGGDDVAVEPVVSEPLAPFGLDGGCLLDGPADQLARALRISAAIVSALLSPGLGRRPAKVTASSCLRPNSFDPDLACAENDANS